MLLDYALVFSTQTTLLVAVVLGFPVHENSLSDFIAMCMSVTQLISFIYRIFSRENISTANLNIPETIDIETYNLTILNFYYVRLIANLL